MLETKIEILKNEGKNRKNAMPVFEESKSELTDLYRKKKEKCTHEN